MKWIITCLLVLIGTPGCRGAYECDETDCDTDTEFCMFTPNDSGRDTKIYDATCEPIPEECLEDLSCNCLIEEKAVLVGEECNDDETQINVTGVAG